MEQVLSQEEIDALIKGLSDGDVETPTVEEVEEQVAAKAAEVSSFDFVAYTKGKKERLPALDFIYDRFCKSFRAALSMLIEKEIEVNLAPLQYVEYDDIIKKLPLPTNMNVVATEGVKGFFIVIFDAKLIFAVLETIFGSTTISPAKIEGREFTKIEFNVIKKVIDIVSAEMEKAWNPVINITCTYTRSEINPKYITMVSSEETVSLAEFSIEIGETTSWMRIVMPYGVLETIKGSLLSTPAREDLEMRERWYNKLRSRVYDVPLEVRAILARKKLTLEEFVQIKQDSIIIMDKYVNDPVDMEIDPRVKFKGKAGVYKGNKAVRVDVSIP